MSRQIYLTDDWPADVLLLLGKIVVASGQLDYVVDLAVKRAAGKDFAIGMEDAARLFSIECRLKKVGTVVEIQCDQNTLREFGEIAKAVNSVWDKRNKVMHALYGMSAEGEYERVARVSKRPYQGKNLGVDGDTLASMVNDLRYWRDRLNDVTREMFLARPRSIGAKSGK